MAELAYSVVQTAKILGCGKDAVYTMVEQNRIPYIRTGTRRVIIPKSALEKWLLEKPFENVEWCSNAITIKPGRIGVQSVGMVKHPALKPGCGGRKRKTITDRKNSS
ncbi:MAG: excisionase family DNA-binding protein [Dehalococcoidia bacterium]|jgi:excisionase family DNA binding protein